MAATFVYENRHEPGVDPTSGPCRCNSGFLRQARHRPRSSSPMVRCPIERPFPAGMGSRFLLSAWRGVGRAGPLRRKFQAVPPLCFPGVHAFDPSWSANGKWVAYTAYPDHALWRSRSDGTDPLQLTFPPGQVFGPSISPDGKQVVYVNSAGAICLIGMDGGTPQEIAENNPSSATWSPDGNLLAMTIFVKSNIAELQVFDFRTRKLSPVPSSQGVLGGQWVAQDMLVAAPADTTEVADLRFQNPEVVRSGLGRRRQLGHVAGLQVLVLHHRQAQNRRLCASGSPTTRWKPSPA